MRSKLFRIGFGVSLAVFMGMAGVFGGLTVLPKTVLAESESFTTETGGLIVPKADDPVIFTTESGIDIKYGNGLPDTYGESLSTSESGLSGFPYFTTTKSGTTYTWVIIGQSTTMINPFLDNSPAGLAIKNDTNKNLEKYHGQIASSIIKNSEIPANSVLCWLNTCIDLYHWAGSYLGDKPHMYFSSDTNYANQKCTKYYDEDTFGFESFKSDLELITVTQRSNWGNGANYTADNWTNTSVSKYFFPLGTHDNSTYENFRWKSYVSTAQAGSTGTYWGRSQSGYTWTYVTNTAGTVTTLRSDWASDAYEAYMRPACVLDII